MQVFWKQFPFTAQWLSQWVCLGTTYPNYIEKSSHYYNYWTTATTTTTTSTTQSRPTLTTTTATTAQRHMVYFNWAAFHLKRKDTLQILFTASSLHLSELFEILWTTIYTFALSLLDLVPLKLLLIYMSIYTMDNVEKIPTYLNNQTIK